MLFFFSLIVILGLLKEKQYICIAMSYMIIIGSDP